MAGLAVIVPLSYQCQRSETINKHVTLTSNYVYLKNYVQHPFKIKGYILMNFAIP